MTSKEINMKAIEELNLQIIDGDRGKNYPHKDELFEQGDCLFLSAQNVTSKGFDFSQIQFITKEKDNILRNGKLQLGDIVITTRGTVGNVALYSDNINFQHIRINSGMLIIRCGNEINNKYLYYILSSNYFAKLILATQSGTAQPQLPKSHFQKMQIPIPPFKTQQEIAKVLSAIDKKIELNNSINNNLEQQAQAIFKSWFVDFEPFGGTIPDDWCSGIFQDIVEFSNGYAFKSSELLNQAEDNCYDVFKQGHINRGGGFNCNGTKSWYPIDKTTNLEKYILKKGDILMAMTDMKDNVAILGNTALMEVDNKYIVNQRVGLLRCKNDFGISYPYVYILTNSTDFLTDLRKRANSGVQVNLSSTEIKNSEIIIAPKEINIKFDNIVKPLFEQIFNNDLENQTLTQLRDTLLPKLMSGEIDVNNIEV